MAWLPIAGLPPQFAKNAGGASAANHWLKFYRANTTTTTSMATDSTGAITLVKCKLNSRGEPQTNPLDEDSVFIPFLDSDYKAALYQTEAEADADNTSAALWVVDGLGLNSFLSNITDLSLSVAYAFNTVADMISGNSVGGASVDVSAGMVLSTLGYYSAGDGGGAVYVVGSSTANGYDLIDLGGSLTAELQVAPGDLILDQFGARGDGITDDRLVIVHVEAYAQVIKGAHIYFSSGKTYKVSAGIEIGTDGQETFFVSSSKNSAVISAMTDFTGGVVIELSGGLKQIGLQGANISTPDHVGIWLGNPSVVNPFCGNYDIINRGGFYDFVKTEYEFDRAVFDGVTSEVQIGHSVFDLQTSSSHALSANPVFKRLSIRNGLSTRLVGDAHRYGIILRHSEGASISGLMSNFDNSIVLSDENRDVNLNGLIVLDLRSTTLNNLWEDVWQPATAYSAGEYIRPTHLGANGHFYLCTTSGTTGAVEPAWPSGFNLTVADGTVVWTEIGASVGLTINADQQVTINQCRIEDGIVAIRNKNNANISAVSSRFVGESMALLNTGGNPCSIQANNNLWAGSIDMNSVMYWDGCNNNIQSNLISTIPSHQFGRFTTQNIAFSGNNGIDFSGQNTPGATTQLFEDYARGSWVPTVTSGANCSAASITTSDYEKIGNFVFCEIEGSVTVTSTSTDTQFKFTVPINMASSSGKPMGSIHINWGGFGIATVTNWTVGNSTEVGFSVPATFVNATGANTFSGGICYRSV